MRLTDKPGGTAEACAELVEAPFVPVWMKGFLLRDAGCEARVAFFAQRMLATARRRRAMKTDLIPRPIIQDISCLLARLLKASNV